VRLYLKKTKTKTPTKRESATDLDNLGVSVLCISSTYTNFSGSSKSESLALATSIHVPLGKESCMTKSNPKGTEDNLPIFPKKALEILFQQNRY
jgi:hypothetical protein